MKSKVRKYGAFTGADFTNTTPEMFRCPYLRNMYKDYTSQNGAAVETRPGFRTLENFEIEENEYVNDIKFFDNPVREEINIEFGVSDTATYQIKSEDNKKVIVVGAAGLENEEKVLTVDYPNKRDLGFSASARDVAPITIFFKVRRRNSVKVNMPAPIIDSTIIEVPTGTNNPEYRIFCFSTTATTAQTAIYTKNTSADADFEESGAYIFTNKNIYLYSNSLMQRINTDEQKNDYKCYYRYGNMSYITANGYKIYELVYSALTEVNAYVPLYAFLDNAGVVEIINPINLLSPSYSVLLTHNSSDSIEGSDPQFFYTLPIGYDAKNKLSISAVYKNGVYVPYTKDINTKYYKESITQDDDGNYVYKIAFNPWLGSGEMSYDYIGFDTGDEIQVVLTYADNVVPRYNPIKDCTITEIFENKVFFSGNPKEPNKYYWTALDDPTYVPITNFEIAGLESNPITALLTVNDVMYALKNTKNDEPAAYEIKELITDIEELAATYPNSPLRTGADCLSAVVRFIDDPLYISKDGVKAIGRQSVYYERAIEHRSTLIDSKLLQEDLSSAKFAQWRGYLCMLFSSGNLYLADSRQLKNGQYEWFLWTDIGLWSNAENTPVYDDEEETILRHTYKTGGVFNAATAIAEYNDKLYFTAEKDGEIYLCQFNTDILREDGMLEEIAYSDGGSIEYTQLSDLSYAWLPEVLNGYPLYGRPILNGLSTIRDNGGTYSLTKTLNKKGFAMLMKSFIRSGCKVRYKVSGDTTWHEMSGMFSTSFFDFETVDFADTSFNVDDRVIVRLKKKVKKFDDISFLIYNNEVNKPFGIYEMQAEIFYGGYGK